MRKSFTTYSSMVVILILSIIIVLFINSNRVFVSEQKGQSAGYHYQLESETLDKIDDLIGQADIIVFGQVKAEDTFNQFGDEFVFKIDRYYKGKTKRKRIYIYEPTDLLKVGQDYILFLYERNIPYFADVPNYTTLNKRLLFGVNDGQIHHSSGLLEQGLRLEQFEHIIQNSDQINQINAPILEYPIIEKKRLTVKERFKRADFVAHIKISEVLEQNKYVTNLKFTVEHSYKDEVMDQYNIDYDNTLLILPGKYEVGEEYIVFLIMTDMLYPVSYEGSIVSRKSKMEWNRVTKALDE